MRKNANNMVKPFWQSKGVWVGVLTALVGSVEVIRAGVVAGDFSTLGVVTLVLGVLKVWERVSRNS